MDFGSLGYYIAASLFLFFAILMTISWRGRLQGGLLLLMAILTVVWAIVSGRNTYNEVAVFPFSIFFELLRNIAAYAFLLGLLKPLYQAKNQLIRHQLLMATMYVASVLLLIASFHINSYIPIGEHLLNIDYVWMYTANMLMAAAGLNLLVRLYQHTHPEGRHGFKYLFYGFGLIFCYDFFMYMDASLYGQINAQIWLGRGFAAALSVPLLTLAAQRNPSWSLEVFVSKQLVFHTATFIGIGLYLLLMAVAGYYIKTYAGSWGGTAQILFLSVAILLLISALYSGDLSARIKVFINKHFFNYKYDYRDEWTDLTRDLSKSNEEGGLYVTVINSIARIIASNGGMLWLYDDRTLKYQVVANTFFDEVTETEAIEGDFATFLFRKNWIIDLKEMQKSPEDYEGLTIPAWLQGLPQAWLVIPLRHMEELYGFLVLAESRIFSEINWEDRDLLKTACMQAVSYLAFQEASESLAKSEKFAVFNRLSAFVVHDLKNLIAQLELITRNAKKFKHNPEFVDDAFETVEHASQKMGRMLTQLTQGRFNDQSANVIDLCGAMEEIIGNHEIYKPNPHLHCALENVRILVNHDRFISIVGHIIKNAQEATDDDGYVKVEVYCDVGNVIIKVMDNGCGMDEQFIKEKLFSPFITTKGNAGMGVGVYECREFIESLGGQVTVSSSPGLGSEFILSIPAKCEQTKETGAIL